MLPSTGYFNGINCPFYDNGLCERPYCHYRHVKKDFQSTNNEGIESGAILQKLVSAAVQRVLQQTDGPGPAASVQQNIVEKVLDSTVNISTSTNKATYNPTPIAELNKINNLDGDNLEDANEQRKRHIPVPYTPRKPTSLPIKRPIDDSVTKPFVFIPPQVKYTPGSTDNVENDKYTPLGAVESTEKYLPGTEKAIQEYTPDATSQDSSIKRNYVPSTEKTANKKKILEYKPTKVTTNTDKPIVTYQPTPRSLAPCFSSDEEEPDPKKMKISNDLNGFDDLGPEFDILDQILDEEKEQPEKDKDCDKSNKKEGSNKSKQPSEDKKQSKDDKVSSSNKYSNGEASHSEKKDNDKSHRSHHKSKSEKKEKSSSHGKDKHDRDKQKHKKSSHRSSSKDRHKSSTKETDNISSKDRDNSSSKDRDKSSSKDRDHSSSKHRDNSSSKHRDNGSSKDRDKGSNKDRDKDKGKESSRKSSKDKKSDISLSPKHSSSKSSDSKKSKSSSKSKRKEKDREHHKKSSKDTEKSKEMDDSDPNDYMDENGHEDEFDLSDADEETIAMECKKIFEEYVPMEKPVMSEDHSKMEEDQNNEYIPSKKRISRTADKNIKVIPKAPIKPNFKVNAAHTMAERLAKVREFHSSRHSSQSLNNTNNNLKPDVSQNISNNSSITLPGNSKIRIAHVPYASTLLSAKKTISLPPTGLKNQPSTSSTISQTIQKGSQRVAHIPNEKFIDRPGVLEPLASKIPANIRSTYLNMMIDECLKLYVSVPDAYARAQNEELTTSKKCSTVQIYKNSAVMTVSRLRRELQECNGVKKSDSTAGNTQSNSSGSWSIEGRNKKLNDNSKEFVGARFYSNIKKWVLTEEQLRENGFPRPHESGEKGRANIYSQNKQKPPKGYFRTCCRCKKEYTINKKGFAVVKEECIYHPNNKYRVRGEARYQCCSQDATSDGCCIAPCHVYEYVDYDNLKGYVKTMPPEKKMDDYGIYSLDCEMCYTTHGLDLTRITVINSACKVVYETLIKPLHPIIDYNTRYSGITEEQMSEVKTTLLEVQATLLAMFNSKTILVGHSLESDFKALKLIHDTVIDTSVLFPHKMGPPYKRALRNLSSEHLKKIIQNSVDGHDSAEDAMVCMELLHYKLKEDLKTR